MKKYDLEFIDFEAVTIVGKKTMVKQGGNARQHWQWYLKEGYNEQLQNHPDKVSPDGDCIGWMGDYNSQTKTFVEMPGVFIKLQGKVPEGFDAIAIPACKMAILWITDQQPNLEKGAHKELLKRLKKTEYEPDYSYGFSAEYYTSIGYARLDHDNPSYKFGYLLPCKAR